MPVIAIPWHSSVNIVIVKPLPKQIEQNIIKRIQKSLNKINVRQILLTYPTKSQSNKQNRWGNLLTRLYSR